MHKRYNRISFILLGAAVAAFLLVMTLSPRSIILALWISSVLGWFGLATLKLDVRWMSWAFARCFLTAMLGGSLCLFCVLPRLIVWQGRAEAIRLIPALEAYRDERGVYPESFEELAAAQDPPVPIDAFHYETYDEGREFWISSTSWDSGAGYDSAKGRWKLR